MNLTDKRKIRLLQGLVLSMGSPLGWAAIQWLLGHDLYVDYQDNMWVYWYMFLGSAMAFMAFGFYVGKSEAFLAEQAVTDSLTGLYNSRFFSSRLPEEFARVKRLRQHIGLIYIKLDHFADINNLYGLQAGDKSLIAIASAMSAIARKDELIARVGGGEFCIILTDSNEFQAVTAAQRFLHEIRSLKLQVETDKSISVTASMGVVSSEMTEGGIWQLYAAADSAMYKAKHRGRNQIGCCSEE